MGHYRLGRRSCKKAMVNWPRKKISVADYNEIKVDGVIDFNYEQSDDPSTVEVTVDQNLHSYVNIEVKDRVLTIAFKGAR